MLERRRATAISFSFVFFYLENMVVGFALMVDSLIQVCALLISDFPTFFTVKLKQ